MFKVVYKSNWISKIFLGVLAFVFIIGTAVMFGPGSWNFGFGNYVLKVGDITVTPKEYRLTLATLQYRLGNKYTEQQLKQLALNELIVNSLFAYLAERNGFYVSQKEIADFIRKQFSVNGTFSPQLFEQFLQTRRLTPKEYEEIVRKELLAGKYKSAVFSTTYVNDQTLRTVILPFILNLKVKIYTLPLESVFDKISVSDEELKDFYEKNKDRFAVEESARVVIYKAKTQQEVKTIYETLKEGKLPAVKPAAEVSVDKLDTLKGELKDFAQQVLNRKNISVERLKNGEYLIGVFIPKGVKIPTFEEIKPAVEKMVKAQKAIQYLNQHRKEYTEKILKGELQISPVETEMTAYELMNRYGFNLDTIFQILQGRRILVTVNGRGFTVIEIEGLSEKAENIPIAEFKKYVRNQQYTKRLQQVIDYVLKNREVQIEVNKNYLQGS